MALERSIFFEGLVATRVGAPERTLARVVSDVDLECRRPHEPLSAVVALVRLLSRVPPLVI